jgi:hypothetical protein
LLLGFRVSTFERGKFSHCIAVSTTMRVEITELYRFLISQALFHWYTFDFATRRCPATSPKHDSGICRSDFLASFRYYSIPSYFDLTTVRSYVLPDHPESTHMPQTMRQNLARLNDTWHLLLISVMTLTLSDQGAFSHWQSGNFLR